MLEPSRTAPVAGALFAVNMLSATAGGNSYTMGEIQEDLESAGFAEVELVRRDEGMHSVVRRSATVTSRSYLFIVHFAFFVVPGKLPMRFLTTKGTNRHEKRRIVRRFDASWSGDAREGESGRA